MTGPGTPAKPTRFFFFAFKQGQGKRNFLTKPIIIMANISLKLGNMRKSQKFSIYPVSENDLYVTIQSNKRIGRFHLETGEGILSVNCASGAYFHHLSKDFGAFNYTLTPLDLQAVRMLIQCW